MTPHTRAENLRDGIDRRPGGCAHGFRKCVFCGWPLPVVRHKLRCAACGRFRPATTVEICGRCKERGFEPLRLFAVVAA